MSRPATRIHLDYLDGLRGWAALFVVLHHEWQFAVGQIDLGAIPRWFRIMTVLKYGPLAVTVFIVLSGYSLTIPVARGGGLQLDGGIASFAKRRFRRIVPAYVASLTLSLALVLLHPGLRDAGGTQWDLALPALQPPNLLAHSLLIHNWFESTRYRLNPPLWSVALEWQIYFAFAFVLLPSWRRFGLWCPLLISSLVSFLPGWLGDPGLHSWYVLAFVLGSSAAWLEFSPEGPRGRVFTRVPWCWLALFFLAPVTCWLVLLKGDLNNMDHWLQVALVHTGTAVATMCFLVYATAARREGKSPLLVSLLMHRYSVALGASSYSLYLIHYPLIAAIAVPLRELRQPPIPVFCTLLASTPLIMCVAVVFSTAFERPYLRAARAARTTP